MQTFSIRAKSIWFSTPLCALVVKTSRTINHQDTKTPSLAADGAQMK
jgi:hypothetical protein